MGEITAVYEKIRAIKSNVANVLVGKEKVTDLVLTALIADGHVLLEDMPGTGKTMLAKTIAKSIDGDFKRIQFTPDLLPSDITGINYYNQKQGEFVFREGPVFGNIILADEINRATPRTQSSLLEAMEERQVTVDGVTRKLANPYIVIATENPIETGGTYPLPEAQLDRFLLKIGMGYPDKKEEIDIIDRFLVDNPLEEIKAVCSIEDILIMKQEMKSVFVHASIKEYIVNVITATRENSMILVGASPRATLALIDAVRAYAMVAGRGYVVPEDVKALAAVVLAHRIVVKNRMSGRTQKEELIEEIVDTIEVPTEDWSK